MVYGLSWYDTSRITPLATLEGTRLSEESDRVSEFQMVAPPNPIRQDILIGMISGGSSREVFDPLQRALAFHGRRTLAIQLPGFGDGDYNLYQTTWPLIQERLRRAIDAAKRDDPRITKVHLIGHSIGAQVAIAMNAVLDEMGIELGGLNLVNPCFDMTLRRFKALRRVHRSSPKLAYAFTRLAWWVPTDVYWKRMMKAGKRSGFVEDGVADLVLPAFYVGHVFATMMEVIDRANAEIPLLRCPVSVDWSQHDVLVERPTREDLANVRTLLRHSSWAEGHMLPLTRPAGLGARINEDLTRLYT